MEYREKYMISSSRFNTYMYPSVREQTTPFNQERLSLEGCYRAELEITPWNGMNFLNYYAETDLYHGEQPTQKEGEMILSWSCSSQAGQSSFVVIV